MYYIKINYFFYENTIEAPSFSFVYQKGKKPILTFKNKEDAVEYLLKNQHIQITKSSFMYGGRYTLRHGEYSRPEYFIKKLTKSSFMYGGRYILRHGEYSRPEYYINKTTKPPIIIKVKDIHNKSKIHCYKFYQCGHVYYNQQYGERLHYSSWTRLYLSNYPSNGYHKYYLQAKAKYNKMKQA